MDFSQSKKDMKGLKTYGDDSLIKDESSTCGTKDDPIHSPPINPRLQQLNKEWLSSGFGDRILYLYRLWGWL